MRPEFGIIREKKRDDGFTYIEIDTKKAKYQKHDYKNLGPVGKRKFENFLVITRPRERLRITYI